MSKIKPVKHILSQKPHGKKSKGKLINHFERPSKRYLEKSGNKELEGPGLENELEDNLKIWEDQSMHGIRRNEGNF